MSIANWSEEDKKQRLEVYLEENRISRGLDLSVPAQNIVGPVTLGLKHYQDFYYEKNHIYIPENSQSLCSTIVSL